MKPLAEQFVQTAPHKLELKRGGGCLGWFGLPFFLAGLFMLLISMRLIPVSNAAEIPWWNWIIIVGMGLVFTAVGGVMVFGRTWITVDIAKGRIWIARGLLQPMWGRTYNLKDYHSILLNQVSGDSDSADSYEIVFKSVTGGELPMLSSQDYGCAHAQALLLAGFVQLPLEDRSSDHHDIIKPGALKQKLSEPVFSREFKVATPPPAMKSDIRVNGEEVTISIPKPKISPYNLLELLIPFGIATYFGRSILPFFSHTGTPIQVQMGFGGFVGLFFVLLPLISILKRYLAAKGYFYVVIVNRGGITIKQNRLSKTIPADRIIALDYATTETALRGIANAPAWVASLQRLVRSKGVIIKSKDGFFNIAAGLANEEVEYLYTVIKQYLALG